MTYTTAKQIIEVGKSSEFEGLKIPATKKIKGHATVVLSVPKHNIYDLWVYGSGSSSVIERINLRDGNADEKLSQYI